MNKLLNFIGMTIRGYVGWCLGAPISFFTAFILSMVGTGAGLGGAIWISHLYL
jgi:hypothetical protein